MTEIPLTGLRADLPIGFMAACGCLRICERTPNLQGTRLRWVTAGGSYTPVLSVPATPDELIRILLADVKGAPDRFSLTWSDELKSVKKDQFVNIMKEAYSKTDWESLEWFAAFGTELEIKEKKGTIEPTPLDMSGGPQRFLANAATLAKTLCSVKADVENSYREALFEPWLYRDDQHSLGWDASTMKLGAFTYMDPSPMKNSGVRAAVWLAFESLPLFPCFFNGRLRTRAFQTRGRTAWFHWPVWDCPLSLAAVRTLLSWPIILEASAAEKHAELKARGIMAVYRSAQFKPNKYLTSFRIPELIYAYEPSTGATV